ncbi:MAG: response regulator [Acetobacteraceae bacterium]|nr:response regulator [Acetobacteraceae bacterium]
MRSDDPVNILLVDDQPAKLLSYEVILDELGENLLKASSGREALELLLRHDVAVVLVDVSMPELDGFELAAMIREHPRFSQTAIIFVSAIYMSDLDRLRGYAAGAVDYLPVPIVPELLRAKVRVFADLYRKTKQLEHLNAELERRVAERTAELEQANSELESRVEARTREREAALATLAEVRKIESLGQLTGGVAHDFNNLLTVIQTGVRIARKSLENDSRALKLLDSVAEAAERGTSLVKRMLAFARRQELKPELVDVANVIENMTEMLSHSLNPTIRIVMDAAPGLPRARVDRNQLELALLNLALNARDAMPLGGSLSLTATKAHPIRRPESLGKGEFVQITVADTGVGMDAEILKRAAEPFFTTKGVGKGSGLGLSIVHGLAAQSGGALEVTSQKGIGTTVNVWLPTAAEDQRAGESRSSPESSQAISCRILLVDDDPLVLITMSEMLRELGHEIVEASSAQQALDALRGGQEVDLVITDYAMPDMSGFRLAQEIRIFRPDLPVLLTTGYTDHGDADNARLPRLNKPFSEADLAREIARLVPPRYGTSVLSKCPETAAKAG